MTMSTEENKAIARRFFDLYNQNQIDVIEREVLDPAAVIHLTGMPGTLDRAAFKQTGLVFQAAFPDHHTTIEHQVAEGDLVVTRSTFQGTHRAELLGILATGQHVTFAQVNFHRMSNNKIVEVWAYFDQMALLQQLGVVPSPG
jgi:steroid delta-isomerase-like uncharacterized protein